MLRRPSRRRAPRSLGDALAELARNPDAAPLRELLHREAARACLGPWLSRRVHRLENDGSVWTLACADPQTAAHLRAGRREVLAAWRAQGLPATRLCVVVEAAPGPASAPAPAAPEARRAAAPVDLPATVERALEGLEPGLVDAFRRLMAAAGAGRGTGTRD